MRAAIAANIITVFVVVRRRFGEFSFDRVIRCVDRNNFFLFKSLFENVNFIFMCIFLSSFFHIGLIKVKFFLKEMSVIRIKNHLISTEQTRGCALIHTQTRTFKDHERRNFAEKWKNLRENTLIYACTHEHTDAST